MVKKHLISLWQAIFDYYFCFLLWTDRFWQIPLLWIYRNQFIWPCKIDVMKKLLLCVIAVSVMAFIFTSCAASKRDCQGRKHYKQAGGFYM